jgi:(2R)-ethylmalonyl-CoA mutase
MAGKEAPWVMRTYAGHSSAKESNALYRTNLARGQTGLSIAFDLPTQTGYDADHVLARGEVGRVGVPVMHLGDMRTLLDQIPLDRMNTSMTINATAPWLLALYIALADERGTPRGALTGTVQNDLIKEYLSRGTYIFPPKPSLKLIADTVSFTYREVPKWNPINVCSYHLQEAGATPGEELAFALATAIAVLDTVKAQGQVPDADFPQVFGRISFFVNAGVRLITEICKMRSFTELWDALGRERYGVADEKLRRFRYGVQVNSLGLTEAQPENNVYRTLLEMLAVVLSKKARARAVQLPAWNEALGLPRPWDQQWSLRLQQIVAYESDILEFDDIFDGNPAIEAKVEALKQEASAELARIAAMGGAIAAVETGYMKGRLVTSNARRVAAIERGEQVVGGVNKFAESAPSPLTADSGDLVQAIDPQNEAALVAELKAWRAQRDGAKVAASLAALEAAAREGRNVMEPSIACARAGVTTGEWGETLRRVFGEYRAPTGVARVEASTDAALKALKSRVEALGTQLGSPAKMLVGKPGLDGHSNGAEQIAVRARDAGFVVIYDGIRLTPEQLVDCARREAVHVIGLSVLSGSHLALVEAVLDGLKAAGLDHIPVVVGGIIPPEDAKALEAMGVARVYTPKDYALNAIVGDVVDLVHRRLNRLIGQASVPGESKRAQTS